MKAQLSLEVMVGMALALGLLALSLALANGTELATMHAARAVAIVLNNSQ
ncbi:MAG: hypothetical protein ACP5T3_02465 [Candidatus Micrarchaeia archaeon]